MNGTINTANPYQTEHAADCEDNCSHDLGKPSQRPILTENSFEEGITQPME